MYIFETSEDLVDQELNMIITETLGLYNSIKISTH